MAFSWNLKTVEGPEGVRDMLKNTLPHVQPTGFRVADGRSPPRPPGSRGVRQVKDGRQARQRRACGCARVAVAAGITTEKADTIFASVPYRIMNQFHKPAYDAIRERDADCYVRLEKAGFLLDFGDDDSGLLMKYLRRGSGYYIDVGASDLVVFG